jgi:hypothetical protein
VSGSAAVVRLPDVGLGDDVGVDPKRHPGAGVPEPPADLEVAVRTPVPKLERRERVAEVVEPREPCRPDRRDEGVGVEVVRLDRLSQSSCNPRIFGLGKSGAFGSLPLGCSSRR